MPASLQPTRFTRYDTKYFTRADDIDAMTLPRGEIAAAAFSRFI